MRRLHHLDVHHVVHREDGGETVTSDLAAVCGRHHRLRHAGALGISGDADRGLTFTDERGRPLPPAGAARPPRPDDLPDVAPDDGPTGERLQWRWVTFNRARSPGGDDADWPRGSGLGKGGADAVVRGM